MGQIMIWGWSVSFPVMMEWRRCLASRIWIKDFDPLDHEPWGNKHEMESVFFILQGKAGVTGGVDLFPPSECQIRNIYLFFFWLQGCSDLYGAGSLFFSLICYLNLISCLSDRRVL